MREVAIIACCFLTAIAAAAQSGRVPEYEVKAAFLLNFAKFVEWPPQAFSGPSVPFRVCVLGHDPFGPVLDNIIRGKSIAGRAVVRGLPSSPAEARFCQVLFIGKSDPQALEHALAPIGNAPVLLVGESDDFLRSGGIINFVLQEDRVRFEINREAAERHHLKLSSRLLAVARIVSLEKGEP